MKWVKRIGIGLGAVVALLAMAVGGAYAYSGSRMSSTFDVPETPITVTADPAAIERGAHLGKVIGKCVECHGQDLGGTKFIDDPVLGSIAAPNLTAGKGGVLPAYTDAKLARAIRDGVGHDGRGLLIMPSEDWQGMADDDVAALIAWIRAQPPVDREHPKPNVKVVPRLLHVAGQINLMNAERIDHAQPRPVTMPVAETVEYGKYMANVGGCTGCHGPNLSGGKIPGTPPDWRPPSNITPGGIGSWTEADFFRALREGKRPAGAPIDSQMPWRMTRNMTDTEIRALWKYLRTVPAREYGNR